MLLSGLGAQVTKVEKPGLGDISSQCGPFPGDKPHPDRSGFFIYLNRNKHGITLDVRKPTGREILLDLFKDANVLLEDMPPKVAQSLKLEYGYLKKVNPQLIVVSITPFGQTGPYRDYKAYAINASGIGGMSSIIGDPKREPLTPPFSLGNFQTGIIAANAIMFALMARKRIGKGSTLIFQKRSRGRSSIRAMWFPRLFTADGKEPEQGTGPQAPIPIRSCHAKRVTFR